MENRGKDRDSLKFLLAATALSIGLWSVQYTSHFIGYLAYAVYPFRLFVTFIHEGGHAVATLLTLGAVDRIIIHADGSGLTYSLGGVPLLIANSGYLASTLYGAGLLLLCRDWRHARAALAVTSAGILVLTFFYAGSAFSWMVGIGLTIALALVASMASVRFAHFFLSFLAIQCCLNALYDLHTLFFISTLTDGPSDAKNLERMTFIPAIVWTAVWIVASTAVLWVALRPYLRETVRSATGKSAPAY